MNGYKTYTVQGPHEEPGLRVGDGHLDTLQSTDLIGMILLALVLFKSPGKPFTFLLGMSSNGPWRIGQDESEYNG